MPDITEDTPTKFMLVQGLNIEVCMPYEEGHVCNGQEAYTLNQTRSENLRNNVAPKVKKAQEEAEKNGAALDTAKIQADFSEYEKGYEFGVSQRGSSLDPITTIELELATGKVKEALKSKGYKLKDVGAEKIKELAEQAKAKNPAFRKRAEEIRAAQTQAADDLSVDIPAVAGTPEA